MNDSFKRLNVSSGHLHQQVKSQTSQPTGQPVRTSGGQKQCSLHSTSPSAAHPGNNPVVACCCSPQLKSNCRRGHPVISAQACPTRRPGLQQLLVARVGTLRLRAFPSSLGLAMCPRAVPALACSLPPAQGGAADRHASSSGLVPASGLPGTPEQPLPQSIH